ncbi:MULTISPECIES: Hpt domain-containing protein [Emticicia]|uniref:Hpt domain-containing protein n=1 Tax=Emticicia TaxID=312278 RepID=UPI0007D8C726|nr:MULTISPECIES: Hpt domain-containing protein [Emticicia]
MFAFNPLLNSDYIREMYGDDLTIVQIMFESFLEDNIPIWERVIDELNNKNFKEVGQMVHQIKPTFSMVGLTFLHPKIQDFELSAKTNQDEKMLLAKYENLAIEINHAKLVIIDDLKRLKQLV